MSVYTNKYTKQVYDLIEHHRENSRNGRLLFAGWFDRDNPAGDVNIFEVFESFPDPGVGKLDTYLFPSHDKFPLEGALRLTVTSPSELKDAVNRGDETFARIMASSDKEVVYPKGADWNTVIEELLR